MGSIAEALGKLATDAASRITEELRSSEIGSQIHSTFFSQESELARSPEGLKLAGDLKKYDMQRNQILNQLTKPAKEVQDVIHNNPQQMHSSIRELHNHFTQEGHPVAASTGQILKTDPSSAKLTVKAYSQKLWSQSRLMAHEQVFGKDNEKLIATLFPLYETRSPVDEVHANALLSIASNQFNDPRSILSIGEGGGRESEPIHSKAKLDMQDALVLENKFRAATGQPLLNVDMKKFNTLSVHERSNAIERFSSQRAQWFLAPMIAINHTSTFFNYSQVPLKAVYNGMTSMSDQEVKELTDAAAILGSQHFQMLENDIGGSMGLIATRTKMPEAGRLYNQIFHNPGFNFIRNAQLKFGAAVGYHAVDYWAKEAAMTGNKRAIAELKEMQLNPADIIKRGGQLTQDEKIKAIWHFVNNRAFISRPLDRSLTATRNPWTRMLTMFHGYVTFQQRFMRRELQKMLDSGDVGGIAKFAGTIGLIFPTVAPMLKAAEIFARTGSPRDTEEGIEQDYSNLTNPEDTERFVATYLDMLSYFGSWGMMHSFITASHGDRLALALIGPIAGDTVRTAQDAINLTTKSTKTGRYNIKPLAEDILQQTVPGLGNIVASHFFPKKQ